MSKTPVTQAGVNRLEARLAGSKAAEPHQPPRSIVTADGAVYYQRVIHLLG